MRRAFLVLFAMMPACVVQTEPGIKGDRGEPGDSDAEVLDGLDSAAFMRTDEDTGTVGSISAAGGALLEGERPDLESATLTVRQINPTFGGGASIVNLDAESDANPWSFLRARNINTPSDGSVPTLVEKFRLASDGSVISWGSIGIGIDSFGPAVNGPIANPADRLVIAGDDATDPRIKLLGDTGSALVFADSSNTTRAHIYTTHDNDTLGIASAGRIVFAAGGDVPMVIDSARNVGIGTTTPGATLDVDGEPNWTALSVLATVNTVDGYSLRSQNPSGTNKTEVRGGADGFIYLETGSGAPGDFSQMTTRVTVASYGSVGIGTAAPQATLDVNGTARLARYGSPPVSCDDEHDGTIALTTKHMMCVCDGTLWVRSSDGTTPCLWQ